jgi:D-sedoheptulose 7-phosphate isomerase
MNSDQRNNLQDWRSLAYQHLIQSAELKRRTADTCTDQIFAASDLLVKCFQQGNKAMLCGNGGSAADAQHMAAEFLNRLSRDVVRPGLPAISLTTDTSFLTSFANDVGYDGVFERLVRALGKPGDVLIGISTSGGSTNVVKAVLGAREIGVKTVGLLGEGGELTTLVDHAVVVPSTDTQHVQETLLAVEHVICFLVEQALFAGRAD